MQLGQLERAREALARLERRGQAFARTWIDVTLPRTRAIVAAAEGDVTGALELINVLDVETASRLPFEFGCTLLTKGRLYRRAKQRRAAADSLREAGAIFERIGASAWAERARDELELVGPRRRAPDELTATELRVAQLAATGLTNRAIAQTAFMSEKTVEAHVARIYHKLGIRSRAELGAQMADKPGRRSTRT